jgi:predicted nucleic-acid-binding Zn-ribbon protein
MKNGICPKCGSTEIHTKADAFSFGVGAVALPISLFSTAQVIPYVCVQCGYLEMYVDEPKQRRGLAAKWPKLLGGQR